jgi:hypothetical protein
MLLSASRLSRLRSIARILTMGIRIEISSKLQIHRIKELLQKKSLP